MTTTTSPRRMEIVDALRGFSLAGIVIVHMIENYVAAPTPEGAMEATRQGILDNIILGFNSIFLQGKFFALFSFLFGLSFFIQMDSAHTSGKNFGGRFLWRLILLLGIGYVHHLFYRGDILTIYALLGIFLIPFYKVSNKWILGIVALLFLGVGRYFIFTITGGNGLFIENLSPASPEVATYFDILKNGSITEVFASNAVDGHLMKMDFQLGIFSRAYLTFGFFLLGLYVGRSQFFRSFMDHKRLTTRVLYISLGALVLSIGLVIAVFANLGPEIAFDNWLAMVGLTAGDLANISMTFVILSAFVLLYRKPKVANWFGNFAPYGRMALTNYLVQSLIGTFIFYGWGLGYLGELRNIYAFLLAILIVILQMVFSKWWLRHFKYGPLEWLWRSLTHFKRYPMKRESLSMSG